MSFAIFRRSAPVFARRMRAMSGSTISILNESPMDQAAPLVRSENPGAFSRPRSNVTVSAQPA